MKIDLEYSYDVDSLVKVFKNPDVKILIRYIEVSNKIVSIFKDRQRVDLALKIYERVGWCKEICSEYTYEELKKFYDGLEPRNLISKLQLNLPDEFNEEEHEQEEEDVYREEEVLYDNKVDVSNDAEQRIETIKEANAKRAARRTELRNKKPNV